MRIISRVALAVFFAVMISAPLSAQNSLVRIPRAASSKFDAHLPPLPTDMPWLPAVRRNPAAGHALPEAGSLRALLWQPAPVESWPTLPASQSATAATVTGG